MIRTRLQEHFERVVREDMLALFNRTATFRSIECSIILQGATQMSDEAKYRAACILEIMTGQRPHVQNCKVENEDPNYQPKSAEAQKAFDRIKGAILHRGSSGKSASSLTAADFKAIGDGTLLSTSLRRTALYDFLEKCREFYLPDVLLKSTNSTLQSSLIDETPSKYFQTWNLSKLPNASRFLPVNRRDNPESAVTALTLRISDLLKFPDIETHFEALGNILSSTSGTANDSSLQLIIRPTISVAAPLKRQELAQLPAVKNLKIMNYLLAQFFNPYMSRPTLRKAVETDTEDNGYFGKGKQQPFLEATA